MGARNQAPLPPPLCSHMSGLGRLNQANRQRHLCHRAVKDCGLSPVELHTHEPTARWLAHERQTIHRFLAMATAAAAAAADEDVSAQ